MHSPANEASGIRSGGLPDIAGKQLTSPTRPSQYARDPETDIKKASIRATTYFSPVSKANQDGMSTAFNPDPYRSNYQKWDSDGLFYNSEDEGLATGDDFSPTSGKKNKNGPTEFDIRSKTDTEMKRIKLIGDRIEQGIEDQKLFKMEKERRALDRFGNLSVPEDFVRPDEAKSLAKYWLYDNESPSNSPPARALFRTDHYADHVGT